MKDVTREHIIEENKKLVEKFNQLGQQQKEIENQLLKNQGVIEYLEASKKEKKK